MYYDYVLEEDEFFNQKILMLDSFMTYLGTLFFGWKNTS